MPGGMAVRQLRLREGWEKFILHGLLDESAVEGFIAQSWKRCRDFGVNPRSGVSHDLLDPEELTRRLKRRQTLVAASLPFMKTLYEFVRGSGFIAVLTDEDGYILEMFGDSEVLERAGQLNFMKGANWTERVVGTNAIGTALVERRPLQIFASEHYCEGHHPWTCSAAPVHDPRGNLIGILDMSGSSEKVHIHTLGMIVAAVQAIENQLRMEESSEQVVVANRYFNAIMESISEGLLAVDRDGRITQINAAAGRMLRLSPEEVAGKSLAEIFNGNARAIDLFRGNLGQHEQEFLQESPHHSLHCTVLTKPIWGSKGEISGAVATLREIKAVRQLVNRMAGSQARFTFSDILGQNLMFGEAIKMGNRAAQTSSSVLLIGESGTGKEMFAQAIHLAGRRRNEPFIAINCGAIPRELVGAELFGYEEGAFTGAKRGGCPGKFELADGGTIFLDEIGDMPLDMQINLLRVLQDKQVTRIAGQKVIPVDVRVIAATNRNLEDEVSAGNFRKDLFYRLNVITIRIPPLRERRDDIPLLVRHFVRKLGFLQGKGVPRVAEDVMKALVRYDWPGNVRELENLIEQAINLAEDEELTLKCFPKLIQEKPSPKPHHGALLPDSSLTELERTAIAQALDRSGGRVGEAARILGIGRSTLYRKIKEYRLVVGPKPDQASELN